MDKKKSGSYYTPERLSSFVANYCLSHISDRENISILEPSVGDGSFLNAISNSPLINGFNLVDIVVVEKEEEELQKAIDIEINANMRLSTNNVDYLDFHFTDQNNYSLIIGNPPYVKKNHLTEGQKESAKRIHAERNLSDKSINNIWTSFLVSGITKLANDGFIAMILPLELLQVKFTEEIRNLLKQEFTRIEIFTFNELQFQECKGQDTVLLIGYKQHELEGIFYTNINSIEDLEQNNYEFYQNAALSDSERKWTHHFITPDEYEFLENIKIRLHDASHFVNNKAGIVTAANDFFIVSEDRLNEYGLNDFARPIVQKGFFVNGSVSFTNEDFIALSEGNKPTYLLDFNLMEDKDITPEIMTYLNIGVEREIPDRYKCKQRERWYKVPNISTVPDAFFFKRAHEYPKLLTNQANVLVTDSAYKIEPKEGVDIQNFIFSFYNSLTLAFAELEGRYYGGGVLELTPNEFRVLPIPYVECQDFRAYEHFFDNKQSIEDVLAEYNYQILNGSLGLTLEEIDRIESIRKKLINKRHRK